MVFPLRRLTKQLHTQVPNPGQVVTVANNYDAYDASLDALTEDNTTIHHDELPKDLFSPQPDSVAHDLDGHDSFHQEPGQDSARSATKQDDNEFESETLNNASSDPGTPDGPPQDSDDESGASVCYLSRSLFLVTIRFQVFTCVKPCQNFRKSDARSVLGLTRSVGRWTKRLGNTCN